MILKGITIVLAVTVLTQCAFGLPAPQWLSFKDGKFGVNFGGYHAEAGLGGLLTGNAAHGGLSASAGTPHGQQAGAGLGGILDGNAKTAGGAYAGASAGHGVGASAAIGGGLDNEGGAGGTGAEAHAGSVSKKVVKLGQTGGSETTYTYDGLPSSQTVNTRFNQGFETKFKTKTFVKEVHTDLEAPPAVPPPVHTHTKTIYKKKFISRPHKVAIVETSVDQGNPVSNNIDPNRFFDFQAFTNIASSFSYPAPQRPSSTTFVQQEQQESGISQEGDVNTRYDSNGQNGGSTQKFPTSGIEHNPNFWNDIFNIPISTLTAVNQFLNNKPASGTRHKDA
ncbi:merozoite surface protein 2 isoform X1 [Topomyia yanbarensis]|uniref:merozoite surface protein 2 isoform X1 n=1 Tax=Topomyia yanbarensis TaxID=2498891 RepID=UPI00273CE786|nr:merozoite surface protein 2 isoform X1 [Topomyia yanbarensis]